MITLEFMLMRALWVGPLDGLRVKLVTRKTKWPDLLPDFQAGVGEGGGRGRSIPSSAVEIQRALCW